MMDNFIDGVTWQGLDYELYFKTIHHFKAVGLLNQSQGGMYIRGAMKIGLVAPVKPSHAYL